MPGVVAVTMTGERIHALVQPDADPVAVERAIVALFEQEGWTGRITVLGGRRLAAAPRRFPLAIPRRPAMIAAPIAAAMAMMVATLTGGTSTPIAPVLPKPGPGFAAPARAATPAAAGVEAVAAVAPATAGDGGGSGTLARAVPRVSLRVPKIPNGVSIPKPKPVPGLPSGPGFKPNPKPVPAPDAVPPPAPVPPRPKPKPDPVPVPAPPPVEPAPAPPKSPPPPDDEDDDDDRGDDEQKPRGKSGKPRDDTKKIGHDEDGKSPNHQEHNGDKHGARENQNGGEDRGRR